MIVETSAIILRSMKYGDTSKIVTCYSQQYGQIKILAKGARSSKSKFGSSLEPLTESHLVFYKKEGRDLHLLSKSEIINSINPFISDSDILIEALSVIEIFFRIHHHEEKNESAYELLSETLKALPKNKLNRTQLIIHFYLNLCSLFGVSLALEKCQKCNTKYQELENVLTSYFIPVTGTLICEECYSEHHSISSTKIEKLLLEQLILISNLTPKLIVTNIFPKNNYKELKNILFDYIVLHVEGVKKLQSQQLF